MLNLIPLDQQSKTDSINIVMQVCVFPFTSVICSEYNDFNHLQKIIYISKSCFNVLC